MVRSVACGKEFTVVATHPYEGPTEEVARKLMEEEAIREEEERIQARTRRATHDGARRAGFPRDTRCAPCFLSTLRARCARLFLYMPSDARGLLFRHACPAVGGVVDAG